MQGSDLPVAGFEFVPHGGKLARKGVGTIALAGESQLLLRCDGCVCLPRLQHLGVRGSEKCGTRPGLLPRRGKLAGERLGLFAFLAKCQLLFELRRLSGSRGLQARGTRRIEFYPEGGYFARKGLCPVSLLFELLLLFSPHLGGLHSFRTCGSRRIEFCPEGGKLTREGVCPAPLLFERLLLFSLRLGGLHGFRTCGSRRIEFPPEGGKFTRKGVCPASLLIKRLPLLDLRPGGLHGLRTYDPRRIEFR